MSKARLISIVCGLFMLAGTQAWARTGNGALTVDNNTTVCPGAAGSFGFLAPDDWPSAQGGLVHVNIAPTAHTCSGGKFNGKACGTNADCGRGGSCSGPAAPVECGQGTSASVFYDGSVNDGPCNAGFCTVGGAACVVDSDCVAPFEMTDTAGITSGQIDDCFTLPSNACGEINVHYCNANLGANNSVNGSARGDSDIAAASDAVTLIPCP